MRYGVCLLTVITATCMVAASPAAADFDFTFDSNNQGWFDNQGQEDDASANWSSNAGNPGGALSLTDGSATGLDSWTSIVPATDLSGHYGGTLSIDVKSTANWTVSPDVFLRGGPQGGLCALGPVTPGTSFQPLQFTLDASSLRRETSGCNVPVTPEQVAEVLQDFQGITMQGEDKANSGETTFLDNVHITGGAPVPVNKVTRILSLSYSKKKKSFKGKLLAPQDPADCAAPQKVGVYRRKPGPDHKLGSPMTDSNGAFALKRVGKRGSYYAKVASFMSDLTTKCAGAKATTIHLG